MKKTLCTLAIAAFALLLGGCMTAERLNDVRIGMTKDQVISLLGTPDSTSAQADVEYLTYYLEADPNYGRDRPYMVRLVDGKVESFGRFAQLTDLYMRPVTSAQPGAANFPTYQGLTGTPVVTVSPPPGRTVDIATEIQRLKVLHDQGALTDAEFEKAKAKILGE